MSSTPSTALFWWVSRTSLARGAAWRRRSWRRVSAACYARSASEPTWRAGRRATRHSPPGPAKMLTVTGPKATGGALAPVTQRGPLGGPSQPHTDRSDPLSAAKQVRVPNRRSTSVATLTGRTARSILPPCDTPGVATASPRSPDGLSRTGAEAAWHAVTSSIAGTPHVRISKDGGRTYPARHARPLPAGPPGQPCTVPVYDPGTGAGPAARRPSGRSTAGSPAGESTRPPAPADPPAARTGHHRLPWQQRLPRLDCVSQTHHDRGSRTSTRPP